MQGTGIQHAEGSELLVEEEISAVELDGLVDVRECIR